MKTVNVRVSVVAANLSGYWMGLLRSEKTGKVLARATIVCPSYEGAFRAALVRANTDLYVKYNVVPSC